MNRYIQEIVLFIITFIFVFIIYQLFVVRKAKRKKKKKEPMEVTYLTSRYKLDIKKVNYNRLLLVISLVSSFDIALVVSIIMAINSFILEIVVGFVSTLVIILLSYHIVYLVYKRKGDLDESKRNRS